MQILYFATIREAMGNDGELHDFPATVTTVGSAIEWLAQLSPVHRAALADRAKLRFALDQKLVKADAKILGGKELAIFPPVTGG